MYIMLYNDNNNNNNNNNNYNNNNNISQARFLTGTLPHRHASSQHYDRGNNCMLIYMYNKIFNRNTCII